MSSLPALKRIYDSPAAEDGTRVLAERLWPRGLSKADAAIDHWFKELAPSAELRRWYAHEPERWPEFQQRYRAELAQQQAALGRLEVLCTAGPVTLVFATRDAERSSTAVLHAVLAEAPRA